MSRVCVNGFIYYDVNKNKSNIYFDYIDCYINLYDTIIPLYYYIQKLDNHAYDYYYFLVFIIDQYQLCCQVRVVLF